MSSSPQVKNWQYIWKFNGYISEQIVLMSYDNKLP